MEEIEIEKIAGKLVNIVSVIMNVSKTKAYALLKQGAVKTTRDGETWKSDVQDYALFGDRLKIGKGRFFEIKKFVS